MTWEPPLAGPQFCEYVRSASKPGIKENAFDPLGEAFLCFDRKFYQKDDREKKSIAGVLATFLQWYVLKRFTSILYYLITFEEEQIFVI